MKYVYCEPVPVVPTDLSRYIEGTYSGYVEYKETYSIPGSGYVYNYYETKSASKSFSLSH